MEHLLRPNEISLYSRPISRHIDVEALAAYIDEAERTNIIPAIGGALYNTLVNYVQYPAETIYLYDFLLEGGMYPSEYDSTFSEETTENLDTFLSGLKKAAAYYTLAKIIKGNDGQVTRFGYTEKNSEYGSKPYEVEKNANYRDINAIADQYLAECIKYLKIYADLYPDFTACGAKVRNHRTKYKILGE